MISASPADIAETIDVDLLYQRLFMYVFKLLTNSSAKKLDIGILKAQGLLPALNAQDQTISFLISELLDSLQGRVSALENTVTASLDQIKSLAEDVLGVKKMDNVFEVRLRNISSTPPATLRNGSLREKKTTALLASFDDKLSGLICKELTAQVRHNLQLGRYAEQSKIFIGLSFGNIKIHPKNRHC